MDQEDEPAIESLQMRCTPSQKASVLRRAKAARRSVSEWLRLRLERCLIDEPEPPDEQPMERGHR